MARGDQELAFVAVLRDQLTTPLNRIIKGFGVLQGTVTRLQTAVAPLIGRFAQLTAAIAATVGVQASLRAAQQQADAEARLLAALKGRREELAKIVAESTRLMRITGFADEALVDTAALLVNMGVAAAEVPKALQAAVDTSVALGISLEEATRGIALTAAGQPSTLARRVVELRELRKEGKLAAEGVNTLIRLFGGAAAQVAATPFGKLRITLQELGEEGEAIGNVLIKIANPALEAFIGIIRNLRSALESDFARGLIRAFSELGPLLAKIGTAAVAITAGLLGLKAFLFLVPVVGAVTALTAGIALLASSLVSIPGLVAAAIVAILQLTGDFGALITKVSTIFGLISKTLGDIGAGIAALARGEETIDGLFDLIGVRVRQLGRNLRTEVSFFEAFVGRLKDFSPSPFGAAGFSGASISERITAIDKEVEAANKADARGLIDRQQQRDAILFAARKKEQAADIQSQRDTLAKITADAVRGEENLAKARARARLDAEDSQRQELRESIANDEALLAEELKKNAALQREPIDLAPAEAERLKARISNLGAIAESTRNLIEIEERLTANRREEAKFTEAASKEKIQALLQEAQIARDNLAERRQELENLTATGVIFDAEAQTQNDIATAAFLVNIDEIRARLETLRAETPGLATEFDKVTASVQKLRAQGIEPAKLAADNFFGGFNRGVSQAVSSMDTLSELGTGLGQTFVQGLSGLVDVFLDADQSFRQFAANFLRQIARMILQAALFKAISGLFGGSGSGQPDPPALESAKGGPVFGPGGIDNVPAWLTAGEYVQRKESVDYYGPGVMAAINRMLIPREAILAHARGRSPSIPGRTHFATGGEVAGGRRGSRMAAIRAFMVSGNDEFDRLLAGGAAALRRFNQRENGGSGTRNRDLT